MRIDKIVINNFKSIYDTFELNFNDITGFWKISGPVGSGKTTIGEAIIFGLFGTVGGKNNTDLISWGQKHGYIELWCTSKGHNIYIKRELNLYGQSPIYVLVDGDELVYTNKKDAQDKLESEYYDTSKMILELLCIISFNNFKSLASLNTTDTKKFLDQVLGFSVLTQYAEICKQLKQDNLNKIKEYNFKIDEKNNLINQLSQIASIEKIEGSEEECKTEKNRLKTQRADVLNKYQLILNKFQNEISSINIKQSSIMTLGKSIAKEIDFIKKGICPTCGAKIDDSHLAEKIQEKQILTEQWTENNNKISKLNSDWQTNKKLMDDELIPIDENIREIDTKIIKLKEQSKRLDINTQQIDNAKLQIEEMQETLKQLQRDDAQWAELFKYLSNDIRLHILSSFVPVLNENIQKYTQLLQLPYIITFDNNFKCNINIFGLDNQIPVSSLSTGQLKIVDMIIILGVLGTILGNSGINIIFLDELFSNFDEEIREKMTKVLKDTIKDKTVFIISHQDINQNIFNGNIQLKLEPYNDDKFKLKSKINVIKYDN